MKISENALVIQEELNKGIEISNKLSESYE